MIDQREVFSINHRIDEEVSQVNQIGRRFQRRERCNHPCARLGCMSARQQMFDDTFQLNQSQNQQSGDDGRHVLVMI
jgi:hypothetical protein